MKTLKYIALFVVAGFFGAQQANAQLLNIAVDPAATGSGTSDMSGVAVLGNGPSDQWNLVGDSYFGTTTGDLIDSAGTTTGVTLFYSNLGAETYPLPNSTFTPDLYNNYVFAFTGSADPANDSLRGTEASPLDFSGLAANTTYQLEFYSYNSGSGSDTTYTINGNTETLEQVSNTTAFTSTLVSPGVYSGNYIQVTGMTDSLGNLDIALGSAASNTSGNYGFTGIQIEAVPEPSTEAMMVAGLVALLYIGARKRRQES